MVNAKAKGKRGELEAAKVIREVLGIEAQRGRQYCGIDEAPDVRVSIPDLYIEVKRTEKFHVVQILDRAAREAKEKIPLVVHRPNRKPWVVCFYLRDLRRLVSTLTKRELTEVRLFSRRTIEVQCVVGRRLLLYPKLEATAAKAAVTGSVPVLAYRGILILYLEDLPRFIGELEE